MKIWISNRQRKTAINPERVRKRAGKILSALGWSEAELSLTLLGDRAMARLNRETFGRRGPTNVISFPVDAEPAGLAGSSYRRAGGCSPSLQSATNPRPCWAKWSSPSKPPAARPKNSAGPGKNSSTFSSFTVYYI